MAEFDLTGYLNKQIQGNITKADSLREASERKVFELQNKLATPEPAQLPTWVDQLGIGRNSPAASIVNAAGAAASGASRVAGHLANLPTGLASASVMSELPSGVLDSYGRERNGIATPEETLMLDTKDGNGRSYRDQINQAQALSQQTRGVNEFFDISHIKDASKQQGLSKDLEAGFNSNIDKIQSGNVGATLAGLGGLLASSAGALLNNKEGVLQYILENAPQIGIGAIPGAGPALLGASNVGYAVDTFHQGVANYAKANNGALPPADELSRMGMQAASLAAAEHLGESVTLGASKLLTKPGKDLATAATEGLLNAAGRTSFKDALLNTGKAIGGAAVAEAPVESYQTYMEGQITGAPATGAEIFAGGVIGAASAGGIVAGPRAAYEGAQLVDQAPERKEAEKPAPEVAAKVDAAIQTGDVSGLTDPTNRKEYAPDKAIAALFGHTQTNPDQHEANVAKADEILASLEDEKAVFKDQLRTPEEVQGDIDSRKAELAAEPVDSKRRSTLEAVIEDLQYALDNPVTEAERSAAKKDLARINGLIAEADKNYAQLQSLAPAAQAPADITEAVTQVQQSKADVDVTPAVERIITMAMANPAAVDTQTVQQLIDNTSNGLTLEQRDSLRTVTAARLATDALRKMGDVSREIYEGSKDNEGIKQYHAKLATALTGNNRKAADRAIRGIENFLFGHQNKAKAAAAALPTKASIVPTQSGRWKIDDTGMKKPAVRAVQGLVVESPKLVENIGKEAKAIQAAVNQMQAAYDAKFKSTKSFVSTISPTTSQTTKGTANVTNAPQQGQGKTVQPQAGEVSPTKATGPIDATAGVAGDAVRDAGTPATVESARVDQTTTVDETPVATQEIAVDTANTVVPSPSTAVKESKTEDTTSTELDTETVDQTSTEATDVAVQSDSDNTVPTLTSLSQGRKRNEAFAGRKLAEVFHQMNRAAAWLTQRKVAVNKDADIAKVRPLVDTPNFLSNMLSGKITAQDFFTEALDTDGSEDLSIQTFLEAASMWAEGIRKDFARSTKVREDFRYKDPVEDFINEDGSVDENLVSAVAYGAFAWYTETARTVRQTDEAIKAMLGVADDEAYPTRPGREVLNKFSSTKDSALNSMGSHIVSALGLKASKDAPADYLQEVAVAFGVHGLAALQRAGMVKSEAIPEERIAKMVPGFQAKDAFTTRHLVKVLRNSEGTPKGKRALAMVDSQKGSFGALERLMTAERSTKYASTRPIPFNQEAAKRSTQAVPEKLKETLGKEQSVPNKVIPAMAKAMEALGRQAVLTAAGWRDPEAGNIHIENLDSVLAQNENLEQQFDNTQTLLAKYPEGTGFFIPAVVWKNFRVGMGSTDLNPQTSKLQRFAFYRPNWESFIRLDDPDMLLHYDLGLAQAFGLKVDQKKFTKTQAEFWAMVNDPSNRIKELANALHAASNGGVVLTPEQQEAIGNMADGREGMQTLQALVSLGEYLSAQDNKVVGFKTVLLVGVDGKTNGPILSHLALGAGISPDALVGFLNRGGFYRESDGVSNYNLWYEDPANQDLYEFLASEIFRGMNMASPDMKNLQVVMKDMLKNGKVSSAGRKLAKTPLTSFAFGSSLSKSVENMGNAFVQAVFDRLEEIYTGKDAKTSAKDLVSALNALTKGSGFHINPTTPIEALVNREFTDQEKQALFDAFTRVMGDKVEDTMKTVFAPYIQRRNELNKINQAAYAVYEAASQELREKEMQRLMDAGEIASRIVEKGQDKGKRLPLHGFTQAQEAAFQKSLGELLPQVHTAFSLAENNLKAGLFMAKTERTTGKEDHHTIKANLGQSFQNEKGQQVSAMEGTATVLGQASPGVSGVPLQIHSMDSTVMQNAMGDSQSLNVHDEKANAANRVRETAQAINHSTWSQLLLYSPMRESLRALERQIIELSTNDKLSTEAVARVVASLSELNPGNIELPIHESLQTIFEVQAAKLLKVETIRLGALAKMTAIDQYTWEGGEYQVTKEDQAQAKKELDAVIQRGTSLSPELQAAIVAINAKLEQDGEEDIADRWADVSKEGISPFEQDDETPSKMTAFGPTGKPVVPPHKSLEKFFSTNPVTNAGRVLQGLKSIYANDTSIPNREFSLKLVQAVYKLIDPALTVQYITPDTKESAVKGMPVMNARGWFATNLKNTEGGIYVLSPDFQASGLTPDTLLHELLHAALSKAIRSKSKAALVHIKELETLLESVRAYVQTNKLTDYDNAVSNMDEFLSWGLSNQDFQLDVLAKVSVPQGPKSKLTKALSVFVQKLANLLGFSSVDDANALGVLLHNSVGLMKVASSSKPVAPFASQDGEVQVMPMANAANPSKEEKTVEAIGRYTTQEIFEALGNGKVSQGFQNQLSNLLDGIGSKLLGASGSLQEAALKSEAGNPLATWLKALDTGNAPFASKVVASPLLSSAQEDFVAQQVEASVQEAITGSEGNTSLAYRELAKLYMEARNAIQPKDFFKGDWVKATPEEKTIAQEKYDFVFKMEKVNGDRSDYLSRFAALGLANEEFNNLLKFETIEKVKAPKNFLDRLVIWYDKAMAILSNRMNHTIAGQRADSKLEALVDRLVDIEATKRHTLAREAARTNVVDASDQWARDKVIQVKDKIVDIASAPMFKNSQNAFVQATATMTRVVAGNKADQFFEHLSKMRDGMMDEKDGFLSSIVTELRHPADSLKRMLTVTKRNEQVRKETIDHTARFSLGAFNNMGKDLSRADRSAIGAVFLRTGAHHLLDGFSMQEIGRLLDDAAYREQNIGQLVAKLSGSNVGYMLQQAKSLAYYRSTGNVKSQALMMNTHNIARGIGVTEVKTPITDNQKANAKVLDSLVALYALEYSNSADRSLASEVLRTENSREEGPNGIEFSLKLHKKLEEDAKTRLFNGNPVLMMHGYTSEIYNPHTELVFATEKEGAILLNRGFTKVANLDLDPRDPLSQPKAIYVLKDGGMLSYLSGALSLTDMQSKGSDIHNGYLDSRTESGSENSSANADILSATDMGLNVSLQEGKSFDPRKVGKNYMAPVLNEAGQIVNWRYLMREHVKDSLLERDGRFDQILGTIAGSVFDKPVAKKTNENIVQALRTQYLDDYKKNSERYVLVGQNSKDPELREIWAMLPFATREAVKDIWNENGMMVRKDSVNILFGYRKLSVSTMFKKANDERDANAAQGLPTDLRSLTSINEWQKVVVATVEAFVKLHDQARGYSPEQAEARAARAGILMLRGERMWQEVVKEAKDIIVVKSGVVMLGNIWSNLSLLGLYGVSTMEVIKHHRIAIGAAVNYRSDKDALDKLQTFVATGYTQGSTAEIQREIIRLEDALERNPVRKLIEAGLMPTISEDVSQDDDMYSYKSRWTREVEAQTAKLHPGVLTVGKNLYMTHDTKIYQSLSRITQLSDFVARYTLYQHLTTRKDNPMSEQDAVQRASDAFVNYDLPMHKGLQYSDDMGFTMFTKYFLRIQKELARTMMENPARVLSMAAMHQFMDLGPIVLDSHWAAHLGNNPIESGAFKYMGSLNSLPAVSAPAALF